MEVCQLFLRPLGLKHLQQTFVDHKVTLRNTAAFQLNDVGLVVIPAFGVLL